MRQVDLHVHSNKSDGTYTPSGLVDYALSKNLSAFALTDHDTTDGLSEAAAYAKDKPVEVISGIEFSTEYEGKDIHILGLFIRYEDETFQARLKDFVDSRIRRNEKMCENLRSDGIDISCEALRSEYKDAVITRAHYASYLTKKGYAKSRADAFERFVGDHCKYYVPREKITPAQAAQLVRSAGGAPILAHPTLYQMGMERLDLLVKKLTESGLMGIETLYPTYTARDEQNMAALAKKYGLLPSGGSDFHGANKPKLDMGCSYGRLFIPEEILINIKKALGLI